MKITIVGAGVCGLTAAWVLQKSGHSVRVIADARGSESTSGAAGAVWYPYHVEPWNDVNQWARASYEWMCELHSDAGIEAIRPMFVVTSASDQSDRPPWADALPESVKLCLVPFDDMPECLRRFAQSQGSQATTFGAWRFDSPVIHPERHLNWLEGELDIPLEIVEEPVENLTELPGDAIVNCAGPRAGFLVQDPELTPKFGQIIVVSEGEVPRDFVVADDRHETDLFYVIPREDAVILGGYNESKSNGEDGNELDLNQPLPPVREELTEEILSRCRAAGLAPGKVVKALAGWRPVRTCVRVELEGRIIHNYGHGGAGFTLAFGCAQTVLNLVSSL